MNNGIHHNSFSGSDIEKYRLGQLTPSQMHALEKAALEDPFLADAMEGYHAGLPASQVTGDIDELKERLRRRVEEKKDKTVLIAGWWKIAAALIVIGGAAWVYRMMITKNTVASSIANTTIQQRPEENKQYYKNAATDSTQASRSVAANAPAKELNTSSTVMPDHKSLPPKAQELKASTPAAPAAPSRDSSFIAVLENRTPGIATAPAHKPYERMQTDTVSFNAGYYNNSRASLYKKAKDAGKDTAHLSMQLTNAKPRPVDGDYELNDEKHEDIAKFGADKAPFRSNAFAKTSTGAASALNTFNGQVVDNYLKPVQGASITIRGRNNGVSTDSLGNFSIRTPDSALKVSVNSIGFQQRDVLLRNNVGGFGPSANASNQIILQQNTNALSEVAVIGYGTQKKTDQYAADLLKKMPAIDVKDFFDAEPVIGWVEYNNYLIKNKKVSASAANIHGTVIVRFDLGRKGALKNVRVEKSLNKALDDEALRLVKNGPSWRLLKGKKATASVMVQF